MISDSEPIHENEETPETAQESNDQASQSNPDVPIGYSIPSPPPAKAHCEITYKREKDKWEKFKDGAEVFGIFLLLVYTLYTIRMYYANREAADAAKSAAETAKGALASSEKSFRVEERPYLTVESIKFDPPHSFATITMDFHNSGRTPALDVTEHIDIFVNGKKLSKKDIGPNAGTTIGAGSSAHPVYEFTGGRDYAGSMGAGKMSVSLKGSITYTDIFKGELLKAEDIHITTVCRYYDASLSKKWGSCPGNDVK
jgi:hypothetical protein